MFMTRNPVRVERRGIQIFRPLFRKIAPHRAAGASTPWSA
jgi:hypothetical protein